MNQQAMLRKVRQMQQEMMRAQAEIEQTEFRESAGGVVTVVVMGTKELAQVIIDPSFEAESAEDFEMLGDMITAACSNAYKHIEKMTEEKLGKYQSLLGGMM